MCLVLGHMQQRDPPGDPAATCPAHDAATKAGPDYGRAFAVLGSLRDCAMELARRGEDVPMLPEKAMAVLQQAARAEWVADTDSLHAVLAAAERLAQQLALRVLDRAEPVLTRG
jgi:hypothetical protein